MNEIKIDISFENQICDIVGVNLITGDYNSTKMVFTFDREDGVKIFKMKNPNDDTIFESEIQNNEIILTGVDEHDENASLFKSEGDYPFEVSLYDGDSRLTSISNVLSVIEEQIKDDDKEIEVYKPLFDQLLGDLSEAINEVDTLNITAEKVDNVTTVTITKKDGTEETVEILDGEKGDTGNTPNIQVGTTTTLPAGSNATVTQRGTAENPIFDFGIPKGEDGHGGGNIDYETDVQNKPRINNVEISGNKSSSDLGLQPAGNYLTSESDPVFSASPSASITNNNISAWNNKADMSDIPDVSDFITKSVNDLTYYYLKSETYTQTEVNNLIGAIQQFHYEVVQQLPATGSTNILYLVPKATSQTNNVYDEYVYANNSWELIGDTEIDLSNYVTVNMLNTALSFYTTTTDLNTLLSNKQNTIQYSTMPTATSTDVGKIVQFTGTTDNTYTNGYFYIGTEDNNTYSWENIEVQPSSGGGSSEYAVVTNAGLYTQELAEAVDKEYQKFLAGEPYCVYYWGRSDIANTLIPLTFYYQFGSSIIISGWTPTKLITSNKKIMATAYVTCSASGGHITSVWGLDSTPVYVLNGSGNIELISTNNTTQYPVTLDYHPAHKKYVDDKPKTYSGYDATKTQILKNVQGTLTWDDDYVDADNTGY